MTKFFLTQLNKSTVIVPAMLVFFLFASKATTANADDLRKKLVSETKHDFGPVARGAKSIHRFVVKNPYPRPITIASVRSSCGCTTATFSKKEIAPYGTGEIIADFNTRSFLGKKSATITVSFSQPYRTEIQLIVTGYIRSDIVFDPGAVDFKNVNSGVAKKSTTIISHAGSPAWKIMDIQSGCSHLSAELVELERTAKLVKYRLTTTIDENTPTGFLNAELIVITNDRKLNKISLSVVASVKSLVSVSPSHISIPALENGIVKKTKLVIRGNEEFQITAIKCDDPRVDVKVASLPKKVHFATVTFNSTGQSNLPNEIPVVFTTNLGEATAITVPIKVGK